MAGHRHKRAVAHHDGAGRAGGKTPSLNAQGAGARHDASTSVPSLTGLVLRVAKAHAAILCARGVGTRRDPGFLAGEEALTAIFLEPGVRSQR